MGDVSGVLPHVINNIYGSPSPIEAVLYRRSSNLLVDLETELPLGPKNSEFSNSSWMSSAGPATSGDVVSSLGIGV